MSERLFKSVADQVLDFLRKQILNNEIEPGTMLYIDKLASKFGVSTTPVREALVKLEAAGLVTIQRNKGAVVSEMDSNNILDVLEMRQVLEVYGCESAASGITDEEINRLEEIIARVKENPGNFEYYTYSDDELHGTIKKHIKNEIIKDSLENITDHSRRIRYYAEENPFIEEVIIQVTLEHEAILEAMKKKSPQALQSAMSHHLKNMQERTLKAFAETRNRPEESFSG